MPAIIAVSLYLVDISTGGLQFAPSPGYLWLAVPYSPLLALSIGRFPGAITWIFSTALIVFQGMSGALLLGLIFPSMFLMLSYCYQMRDKKDFWFPITAVAGLPVLRLFFDGPQLSPAFFVSLLTGLAAVAGIALNAYHKRHLSNSAEIESLKLEKERIRREERTQLAYELHDIIAHDVTVIAMQARRAEFVKDPDKTNQILAGIGDAAQQALQDLRSLVLVLKQDDDSASHVSPLSDPVGGITSEVMLQSSGETTTAIALVHDIEAIATAVRNAGFIVDLNISGNVGKIPASIRQALRRTARELGTNILKHAATSGTVDISLEISDNQVLLESSNKISSAVPLMSTNTGLEAMRARCEAFGGNAHVENHFDNWSILIRIPLSGIKIEVI